MKNIFLLFSLMIICSISYGQDTNETVTDIDGNVYKTVKIGTQIWMNEDLKVTKYNNGYPIQHITDAKTWKTNYIGGSYCWYNNDEIYKTYNGALYSWRVIETGNLAPKGWHVPTVEEWQSLIDFLGGEKIAGGKLKEAGTSHWVKPNKGADNSSGFNALPGGWRYAEETVDFFAIGIANLWWSSTKSNILQAKSCTVNSNSSKANISSSNKLLGMSVRCIKD